MWCDWSSNAHDVRHALCSDRQLVNSGATGKACGRTGESRITATADPTRWIAASRLSAPTTSTTFLSGAHGPGLAA